MEGPAFGLLAFVTVMTLVLVIQTYTRLVRLQRHVALIARHLNVDPDKAVEPSERVKALARDPARKVEAIQAFREETGLGLAESKAAVDAYIRTLDR